MKYVFGCAYPAGSARPPFPRSGRTMNESAPNLTVLRPTVLTVGRFAAVA
ncbi:hypothetical protein GS532_16765 [Rhodococcus hoagii]|nr:hypothetical protein [Prescottella equi]